MMWLVLTLTIGTASLAAGLVLSSQSERQIAAAHRRAVQLGYAAEAAAERVVLALEQQAEWDEAPGRFTFGAPEFSESIDARTQALNRGMAARFPLGADSPRWRAAAAFEENGYTSVAWVADDPAERDGVPDWDSNGRLMVRCETSTRTGAVRVIEVSLARDGAVSRRLSWREVW